jgi:transcriptional regulator with XRE-family HTH domain
MRRVLPRYEEKGLGLPYPVVLINAAEEHSDAAGNVLGVSVPDFEGLAAAVAIARAFLPVELTGSEVRFMRKVIGMSAKDFAEALKLDPASLSRWENNKQTLGGWAESQVRLATVAIVAQRIPSLKPDMEKLFRMVPRKRDEGEAWPLSRGLPGATPDRSTPRGTRGLPPGRPGVRAGKWGSIYLVLVLTTCWRADISEAPGGHQADPGWSYHDCISRKHPRRPRLC